MPWAELVTPESQLERQLLLRGGSIRINLDQVEGKIRNQNYRNLKNRGVSPCVVCAAQPETAVFLFNFNLISSSHF
jgi:hypothetical protein